MNDIRKFITFTTCNYFGVEESTQHTDECDALDKFITDAQCLTLCAVIQNELLEYHSEIHRGKLGSVFFNKNTPIALESDNAFQHISITAFTNNPVESLYLSLHHIYGPLLQLDNSMALDPKVQEMLSHLEATLRTIAYGKDGAPSLMVVLTVDDELEYWKTIGADSKTRKQREMSESFISILQPMTEEIRSIEINVIPEIQEALESLGGLLDDLWRHPTYIYPQKRMIHLMDVIGNACVVKLQNILNSINVWGPDTNIITVLKECYSAATCWLSACHSLTQKYWPHHSLHAWEGQPHVPQYLQTFQDRLKEIADIRSIHMQLTKLLSAAEQDELKTVKMFQPFNGIALWQCTPSNISNWIKAKSHFDRLLKPAEDRIAVKLRPRLISSSTKQMLHEFSRYSALIERPTVRGSLQKECEVFCNALKDMLKEIAKQTDNEKATLDNEFTTPDISPLVQHLQWTKKMTNKVSEIENVIELLLKDLDGSAELIHSVKSVQKDLSNSRIQLYEDWTRQLQIELNNKSLILSPESPVVVFSSENNLMHVTFNPRLVSLERDIRHMASLGFTIPLPVKDAVNHAAQFMEHARALQQVANFHNTQADRMILSQRPMMLQGAVKLASLVKEQSAVPWKDIEAVAKYVEKLKEAVSNLVSQNTYLTNQHIAMRNIVLELMDTELLLKQAEWKKGVRQMRDIVDKVEAKGFTNNTVWKTHWDIQLYKALEHQYRSTLINPLPNLSVTRVELIFRQQEVRLQPPLEELRASCHAQLRKLIALPHHFVGLLSAASESESIFSSIVPRNSWLICGALQEVEKTLEKVKEAAKRWSRWGALGAAGDLDSLCELHLQQPQDWDRNFRECKALGQAIAKMPMEDERIDWIWISSASLRSELEAHNRRYWVALTTSLHASLQRDTTALEEYIFAAQNTLGQNVPKNAKELATANEEYHTLKEKESQMTSLLEGLRKKQTMVRAWGGERIRSLDHLAKQWENLTSLMQNHEQLIIHQAESVKSSLLGEWSNLYSSVEVWYSRWMQNKPKADQLANLQFSELQEKHQLVIDALQHWSNFKENKENMIIECRKFNFELEVKPLWKEIDIKMLEESTFWEPFNLFNEAYKLMGSQEWIVFQKKIHVLDEFVGEWGPKLEPLTAITLFIKKEINQFKDVIPSLKHLRGADFTERHWREIYSLLGIPNKPADELVLGDLLNVAATIKIHSISLQKIWSSASQEAIVRGAIAELELWLAGARFVIVKHTDSKGKDVSIIKDYKDILNKVEEYESLAGSARAASGGGGGGSDQLAMWEVRLSQLRVALTSLSHIQRNSPDPNNSKVEFVLGQRQFFM